MRNPQTVLVLEIIDMVVGKISVTLKSKSPVAMSIVQIGPTDRNGSSVNRHLVHTLGAKHLQLPDGNTLFFSGQPTT